MEPLFNPGHDSFMAVMVGGATTVKVVEECLTMISTDESHGKRET